MPTSTGLANIWTKKKLYFSLWRNDRQEWIAQLCAVYNCEAEVELLDDWDLWASIEVPLIEDESVPENIFAELFGSEIEVEEDEEDEDEENEEGMEEEGEGDLAQTPTVSDISTSPQNNS